MGADYEGIIAPLNEGVRRFSPKWMKWFEEETDNRSSLEKRVAKVFTTFGYLPTREQFRKAETLAAQKSKKKKEPEPEPEESDAEE